MFKTIFYILGISITSILLSCNNDDTPEKIVLNSINITVNGTEWIPDTKVGDPCYGSYQCAMSKLDNVPFYNIEAIKNNDSEELKQSISIQFMDVTEEGDYFLTGKREANFESYARMSIMEGGTITNYINSSDSPSFQISITDFHASENSELVGISGSFQGILYNSVDASDSIVIEKSNFVFKKVNAYNFDQCSN